ncbi:uncharacterized protein L201_006133 [Kwoniella dendrophila CBS 6074]|uniref:F-box domain-containing protein n=1 Tax=Kwoniella dendrophila CBS 6074 TaxID=1295534 RepID=A0AAX4K0X0_9TREE
MTTTSAPSAGERIWSIPAIRDVIINNVPERRRSNLLVVSKAFFEPVVRSWRYISGKRSIEMLLSDCKSKERSEIYKNSIRDLIFFKSDKDSPYPARWLKLYKLYPNLVKILSDRDGLDRETLANGIEQYTYRYIYKDTLTLNPKEPFKKKVGIPKQVIVKRHYHLEISYENFKHLLTIAEIEKTVKDCLIKRIEFYGESPIYFTVNISYISNTTIFEALNYLSVEKGIQPAKYFNLNLNSCDSSLPNLVNFIGKNLHILIVESLNYKYTEITFEYLFKLIKWEELTGIKDCILGCRRDPLSEDEIQIYDNDSEEEEELLRTEFGNFKNTKCSSSSLDKFNLELIYPPDTQLSSIQLEHEKQYVRIIGDVVFNLLRLSRYANHGQKIMDEFDEQDKIRIAALYEKEDQPHVLETAIFSSELNKAFLERIIERMEGNA